MKNKETFMPWSTRLAVLIMMIALFVLLFIAKKHPEQQQYTCDEWFNLYVSEVENNQIEVERGASKLREEGCYDEALKLQQNLTEKSDDNLTNIKQAPYRRLNSNGYSQRYVELYGNTKQERIISLLNIYGFDGEDTRYTIRTISRIYRVYPEIVVCIAYADSSLGRFLKTKHNYGNVGNNDRGDTISYSNMEQGFNAIAKVLNNQYLGSYSTINQLSRRGNETGMVYATSPENWHINVTNCLSMIHNMYVPDNFNYRW